MLIIIIKRNQKLHSIMSLKLNAAEYLYHMEAFSMFIQSLFPVAKNNTHYNIYKKKYNATNMQRFKNNTYVILLNQPESIIAGN